jgi:very-short-patch-repair endonuclease
MAGRDGAAARVAEGQHGMVTHAQAVAAGLSRGEIRHRRDSGRWVAVDPLVYRIAGLPVGWHASVLAAVLGAGDGAVASHRTAGVLWQLDGCRQGVPELTLPRGRRHPGRRAARLHWSTDLGLTRPVRRHGIPTTPVDRTLLDLAGVVGATTLHLAVDDARRRGLIGWDGLVDVLVRHARRGRRGVGGLRRLLDEHAAEVVATDSGFERLVVAMLCSAGLPAPVLQHPVAVGGRDVRLDLAYPPERVGIELDGSIHLRRDVWEADHARQNALVLAGWTILRFTFRDYRRRPGAMAAEVARALAAAA